MANIRSSGIFADRKSGGGLFHGLPMDVVSYTAVADSVTNPGANTGFRVWHEPFNEDMADTAASEVLGWTQTNVGAGTGVLTRILKETGYMEIVAGSVNDGGSNLQLNAAPVATKIATAHQSAGPMTSTASLMDNRELIFHTRIGPQQNALAWVSKFVLGWCVTDTAILTAATGVLPALATGGGMGFHVNEDGDLAYFSQRADTLTAVESNAEYFATLTSVQGPSLWTDLGFRARWIDASDDDDNGVVDFYVNGGLVGSIENNLPMSSTQTYGATFEVLNGGTAAACILAVDHVLTAMTAPGRT